MYDLWFHGLKWNFSSQSSPKEAMMISYSNAWLCNNLLKLIWVSTQTYKVCFIDYLFSWLFTSFWKEYFIQKGSSKLISKIQVPLDVLNTLKSEKTLRKIDESKSYKTWVYVMGNSNNLLKIWSIFKEFTSLWKFLFSNSGE